MTAQEIQKLQQENARLKSLLARRVRFTKPQLKEMRNGLLKLGSMGHEDAAFGARMIAIQDRAIDKIDDMLGLLPDSDE